MPIITINLLEGRTDAQKEQLIHKVTEACHTALGAPRESVRIIISDMLKQHYGVGGISKSKSETQ
ncbi:4-oxalocrotonate tautomerase family protein [Pseudomonas fulva]|uniref:2-hydroxymuconate tautomerase n=1 Tax=Pseudomonas putida TaxID=303 RepID=A0A7W2L6Q1_PSEPU|nr:4-oxalocrotonate tautomerase family protein [Pseudomonas fulva]MBA6119385.1 4-oxalocrotonate tautomerase family protein [Pseudomonas putida]MEC4879262.1 4-oxalocrotonate tautomerase family protein [Pseudomonas sp. NC26]